MVLTNRIVLNRSNSINLTVILILLLNISNSYCTKCVEEEIKEKNSFTILDYSVLGAMLIVSCGIGMFIGCFSEEQTTSSDFLLGGSSMKTLPMAMSLAASFVTAIELLGNPAEMYTNGTQFWMICLAFIFVVPLTSRLYLPVFMTLKLTSSFEYFHLRFNSITQYIASGLYIVQMTLYTSVAVYAPALALSHVTGLNVYMAVTGVYVVCIFYASQGGMKAVIITDTFQAVVLIGSIVLIAVFGTYYAGSLDLIYSTSESTNRMELFNLEPNPTIKHGFWSVTIGGTFYWLMMFCANQASIQKYLSVEKISQVRIALWISCISLIFIYTINFYTGMVMLTSWKDCDPLKNNEITNSDQLLPLFVLNILGHIPGVNGLFVAGIFAASLGTVASALNSLAAVTMNDFISGVFKIQLPESKGALLASWISIVYGLLSFALVFIVERLGSIMQVAICFNGMVGGVTLGLFSLGMFFPWANSKGATFSAIVSIACVMFMGIGSQIHTANGEMNIESKFTSVDKCSCKNLTIENDFTAEKLFDENDISIIFRISYLWYSMIGCILTVVIGIIASYFTSFEDPKKIKPELISPAVHYLFDLFPPKMKDFFNLPLKSAQLVSKNQKVGIVNAIIDLSDEKFDKKTNIITIHL